MFKCDSILLYNYDLQPQPNKGLASIPKPILLIRLGKIGILLYVVWIIGLFLGIFLGIIGTIPPESDASFLNMDLELLSFITIYFFIVIGAFLLYFMIVWLKNKRTITE